jgi:hypothetical protein
MPGKRQGMYWIVVGAYIVTHFLLYVVVFRRVRYFGTERGIFLFHLVPAATLTLSLTVWCGWPPTQDGLALIVGAAAAHGIYSLSFLESWALSEGGYSLRALTEIVRRGSVTASELERHFVELSAQKKMVRMGTLLNLQLVRAEGDRFELTFIGRLVANILALIAKLARFRAPS